MRRSFLGSLLTGFPALAVAQDAPPYPQPRQPRPAAAHPSAQLPQQNEQVVGIMTGELGGTFSRFGGDLAALFNQSPIRVLSIGGRGSLQNITDIVRLRGVDLGFVAADTLAYAKAHGVPEAISGQIQYLFKLYENEIHLLAKDKAIKTIADLRGKKVNIDVVGSGTTVTAETIFPALGVKDVLFSHYEPALGIQKVRDGELDAAMYVSGKPVGFFTSLQPKPDEGLHFVSTPLSESLTDISYLPGSLEHQDYPALVPEGDNSAVDTAAVGVVLAVYNWPAGTQRYNNIVQFINIFLNRFPALLKPPYHQKWKEVNLKAEVPGWTRYAPATQALKTYEQSQAATVAARAPVPAPADRDKPIARFLREAGGNLPAEERKKLQDLYDSWAKTQPE